MLVYSDSQEEVAPRSALALLAGELALRDAQPPSLDRHAATVRAFIRLAGLAQGFADAEAAVAGCDEVSTAQALLHCALRDLATKVDASWQALHLSATAPSPAKAGAQPHAPDRTPACVGAGSSASLDALTDLPWPDTVTVKRPEGYAFYALYPESYLAAARTLAADTVIVGIRSIGTGLAALAAAACGSHDILTVRPVGPPFARTIAAGPALTAWVREHAHRPFAIADEGPGLSGSSFGGVADWLEALGVERITFLPSHAGDLGAEASPRHRTRWAAADRRTVSFERLFIDADAPVPLGRWFADLTGPLAEPPRDLSGRWTTDLPTSPNREARKYLLRGDPGAFRAKFVGLDPAARAKHDRARALAAGGFGLEPLALRHGFLLERELDAPPGADVSPAHLAAYLTFRRDRFPAPAPGATLALLHAMTRRNLALGASDALPAFDARWSEAAVQALQPAVQPVHIDGRLHRWEWLAVDGRMLKTDAIDHCVAHDLIGPQDILWDVAGAQIELPGAAGDLAATFTGSPIRADLLAFYRAAYPAFQLGWWSMSGTATGEAQAALYADRLRAQLR